MMSRLGLLFFGAGAADALAAERCGAACVFPRAAERAGGGGVGSAGRGTGAVLASSVFAAPDEILGAGGSGPPPSVPAEVGATSGLGDRGGTLPLAVAASLGTVADWAPVGDPGVGAPGGSEGAGVFAA